MLASDREWRPGSFTKNYAWGPVSDGLKRLHEAIRIGFDGELGPVPRETFRQRLSAHQRPDYIPLNFFLLNRVIDGISCVVPDELAYQGLVFEHDRSFDKLALTVFNLSYVGRWRGAKKYQEYPAVWANEFVLTEIATNRNWDVAPISADSIQRFVASDPRYTGTTSRKLATNLSYMYKAGGLHEMSSLKIERWWVDSVFAALDRALEERGEAGADVPPERLVQYLTRSRFNSLAGKQSLNRDLALQPITTLYSACGGLDRLSKEAAEERQQLKLPHIHWFANSDDPFFAIYPQDPNVIKSIPRACAMLAKELAGFEEIDSDELENWNILDYVRRKTKSALDTLKQRGIRPSMTAEDLMRMTRGK
jgi:hypothetical protein